MATATATATVTATATAPARPRKHGLPRAVCDEPLLRACAQHSQDRLTLNVRNVVLGGGGMNGLMYIGALAALTRDDAAAYLAWRDGVRAIAGTSAGALVGAMIAARLTPADMRALVHASDLEHVLRTARDLPLRGMLHCRAVSSGASTDAALAAFVGRLCAGNAAATLQDFARQTRVDFHVVVTNLRTGNAEFWSAANKPHVPLAHALRCSVAVPMMLPPFVVDGDAFVDGGVTCNVPIHLFCHAARRSGAGAGAAAADDKDDDDNKTLILLTFGESPDATAASPLLTLASLTFMALNAAQLAPLRMAPHLLLTTIVCVNAAKKAAVCTAKAKLAASTATATATTDDVASGNGAVPASLTSAAGFSGLNFTADPAVLDALMDSGALAVIAHHFAPLLLLGVLMATLTLTLNHADDRKK